MADSRFIILDDIRRRGFFRAIALIKSALAAGIKCTVELQILPCRQVGGIQRIGRAEMLHGARVVSLFFQHNPKQVMRLGCIREFSHGLTNHCRALLVVPGDGIFPHGITELLKLCAAGVRFLRHHSNILLFPSDLSYGVILAQEP